ncbi:hypothetical protein LIA77_05247 [Sarocladium implicatum]|nr:hypothetical protein LIA77_05247 [Sarocladium implicatum]
MVGKKDPSVPRWVQEGSPDLEIEYGRPFEITFSIDWPGSPFPLGNMLVSLLVFRRDGKPVANNQALPLWFRGNIQDREAEPVWEVDSRPYDRAKFRLSGLVFTPESCGHSWEFSFTTRGMRAGRTFTNTWEKKFNPITVRPRSGETRATRGKPQDTSNQLRALEAPDYFQESLRLKREVDKANNRYKELGDAVLASTKAVNDNLPLVKEHVQAAGRHIQEIGKLREALKGAEAAWNALARLDQGEVPMTDDGFEDSPQAGSKTKRADAMEVHLDERQAKRQKKA